MSPAAEVEKGAFAVVELPGVLRELIARHVDGRVRVIQRAATRFVWFEAGRVRAINSSNEDEQLGGWLAARNLVDKRLLADLLARKSEQERLGDMLVRRGMLPRDKLEEELETLTFTIAGRMLFEGGEYVAEPGLPIVERTSCVDLAVAPLFVKAARNAPDEGQFARAAGEGLRWLAVKMADDRGTEVTLLRTERLVLERLAEPKTLDDVCNAVPLDPQQIARCVVCLAVAGLAAPCSDAAFEARAARDRAASAAAASAVASETRQRALNAPATGEQGAPDPASPPTDRGAASPAGPVLPPANSWLRDVLASVDPHPQIGGSGRVNGRRPPSPSERARAEADRRTALRLLESGEDPGKAYRLLSRAVETAPDAEMFVKLATIEMGNPLWLPRALEHLRLAVKIAPRCTPAWLTLAAYWGSRWQSERQRRCLEKILAYDAANREAQEALQSLR